MVVHVGSEEILLDDAVRLTVTRAGRPACRWKLRRWDGFWHVAHASPGRVAASTTAVTTLGTDLAGQLAQADTQPLAG
jgi:hypothetical protein